LLPYSCKEEEEGGWQTHVNVFGKQFVGNTVFVNDIVVQSSSTQHCSREETEDTVFCITRSVPMSRDKKAQRMEKKVEETRSRKGKVRKVPKGRETEG
jgi:hypothetical protein